MKALIASLFLIITLVSCTNYETYITDYSRQGDRLPFGYELDLPDSTFEYWTYPDPSLEWANFPPYSQAEPYKSIADRPIIHFNEDGSVQFLVLVALSEPIINPLNPDTITTCNRTDSLYTIFEGTYTYDKKTITITFPDNSGTFDITNAYGHRIGGADPSLHLNDTISFRGEMKRD